MKTLRIANPAARGAPRSGIEAFETVRLNGWVTSGRGNATVSARRNAGKIQNALGVSVIEGSLNIILERPMMFRDDTAVQIHLDRGPLHLEWPGRLNGTDVWLHRWQGAPLHVVEMLSTVHLRKHLHLSNGDKVQIEARKCDVGRISSVGRVTWTVFWLGRKRWTYTNDSYYFLAKLWCLNFGAAQFGTERNCGELTMTLVKAIIKKSIGTPCLRASLRIYDQLNKISRKPFRFERMPLDGDRNAFDRPLTQVRNLLHYTKSSGSRYSAQRYPAGYHTVEINGRRLQGQRTPSERLKTVPVDFDGRTILDIGCNQGGMLFELSNVKWAVGVDYDARMINAANRIKSLRKLSNLDFYVLDLEKEPLELIEDFIPEPRVDIVFLLSVCRWIGNWRDVIRYSASISSSMLLETTGPAGYQELQEAYLRKLYRGDVVLLAERSDDDPHNKHRKLFYCRGGKCSDGA
jgi:SAM-dependent methyltransferase